jgi:glutamine synthetase
MSPTRLPNVAAAQWSTNGDSPNATDLTRSDSLQYGSNVFGLDEQRARLPKDIFRNLQATVSKGQPLDANLADIVASAMKDWALEKGATHYTHWFQPLTNITAEKHDSFFNPTSDSSSIAEFSGKELVKGEPDASSFPNGGLRSTFEARGYTAWDPTSPAFVLSNPNGTYLCIPTGFVSWTGDALDSKIPLLRSMEALSTTAVKALHELFDDTTSSHVFTTVGPEQEYFLVDEQYFYERPDLYLTGRTLFGTKPPKGQELDEHYFGSIPERVLAFMMESEDELRKLGVPVKTRHNEVAPGQFELAPMFENSNVGSDHQQLTMMMLQKTARKYGLVCLLHEKPFAGVNGSGKHNNWAMGTDTGVNLLKPGDEPAENVQFLFFCTAVVQAVNAHQELLRASAASAGQDHRLGANEAPPAIISIFLGRELEKAYEKLETGAIDENAISGLLALGTPVLPHLPLDGGDRNRTSPFAFTGNRFEFRALGSSMSLGFTNTVLNTITAQAIDELTARVEAKIEGGTDKAIAVLEVVKETWIANKRIVFDGDGYSEGWHKEAAERGLSNLPTTVDALPWYVEESTISMFERYNVLSERELESRFEVAVEQYISKINIEAETAASMARTMLLPAALRQIALLEAAGNERLLAEAKGLVDEFVDAIFALEDANEGHPSEEGLELAKYMRDVVFAAMNDARAVGDKLEKIVADDLWPVPKYSEMLFIR